VVLDYERINNKIVYINEQISSLRGLLSKKKQAEIINDPWLIKGIKYSLQTAIEALIDICYHICVKKFSHVPLDARDAMRLLVENGIISSDKLHVYSAMIGFRNRVVHGYQVVDATRVYEIVSQELGDFEDFIRCIRKI